MNVTEERLKILQMVADGTITPEDAARLLEAINGSEGAPTTAEEQPTGRTARWLKVRVTDTDSGRVRVNITLPLMLVRAALKMGGRVNIFGFDKDRWGSDILEALEAALAEGAGGKLVDVLDEEEGERVEVFLE